MIPNHLGEVFMYIPKKGLQKLKLTVKELVNISPFQTPLDKSILMSSKRSTAIVINSR
jgi:hypothetical protein